MYVSHVCPVPTEVIDRPLGSLDLELRTRQAFMWVQGLELRSSARATNALTCWAFPPAAVGHIAILDHPRKQWQCLFHDRHLSCHSRNHREGAGGYCLGTSTQLSQSSETLGRADEGEGPQSTASPQHWPLQVCSLRREPHPHKGPAAPPAAKRIPDTSRFLSKICTFGS